MVTAAPDVVIVGGGHNGLVAAVLLARARLKVTVIEEKPTVGGAAKTERPFAKVPGLATSTGAYLFGLMPPELLQNLDVTIPMRRRDPHYFLPTTEKRFLLFGSDREETRRQFISFFSEADWRASEALDQELTSLREDLAPSWLAEPLSVGETAERYIRPALRRAFVDMCEGTVGDYLGRFGFKSDLVAAMYAVTDGFSGICGTWNTKGTGFNFLVHNMCRLPGGGGTFMLVDGGMGTVTRTLAEKAQSYGATIVTGKKVARVVLLGGVARGVELDDGSVVRADVVVTNADPFRMRDLVGREKLPAVYNQRIDGYLRDGTSFKVNLALKGLPRFTCLPEERGQHGATIHLLPDEKDVIQTIQEAFTAVQAGKLAPFPTIEWYIHAVPPPPAGVPAGSPAHEGPHSSALFVQWVPYTIAGSTWEAEEAKYVKHLLSICDRFAPGTSELVADTFPLNPQSIERHFGITRGHIHHVDNGIGFTDRLPYKTPIEGLYSCSAGCHPAGAVIGAAGHNAAQRVLKDLGRG